MQKKIHLAAKFRGSGTARKIVADFASLTMKVHLIVSIVID